MRRAISLRPTGVRARTITPFCPTIGRQTLTERPLPTLSGPSRFPKPAVRAARNQPFNVRNEPLGESRAGRRSTLWDSIALLCGMPDVKLRGNIYHRYKSLFRNRKSSISGIACDRRD
jgi:hypothetical protein